MSRASIHVKRFQLVSGSHGGASKKGVSGVITLTGAEKWDNNAFRRTPVALSPTGFSYLRLRPRRDIGARVKLFEYTFVRSLELVPKAEPSGQ